MTEPHGFWPIGISLRTCAHCDEPPDTEAHAVWIGQEMASVSLGDALLLLNGHFEQTLKYWQMTLHDLRDSTLASIIPSSEKQITEVEATVSTLQDVMREIKIIRSSVEDQ